MRPFVPGAGIGERHRVVHGGGSVWNPVEPSRPTSRRLGLRFLLLGDFHLQRPLVELVPPELKSLEHFCDKCIQCILLDNTIHMKQVEGHRGPDSKSRWTLSFVAII